MFAEKTIRERRILSEVSTDPFYSEASMAYLSKVVANIDSGRANLAELPEV